MAHIPKPHEIYKSFKGNLYQVLAIAEHTEAGEQLVVYQAMYGDFKIYASPLAIFTGEERFKIKDPIAAVQEGASKYSIEDRYSIDNKHTMEHSHTMDMQEVNLDPMLLEFLDADSYEQRLNILAGLHHRITDEMLTTMALACDVEVEEGDLEERYSSLKKCLLTLDKYECNNR